jgi:hypothetical protein
MKKMITAGLLAAILTLSYLVAPAQQENTPAPKWVSEKGYWVVEGNLNTPHQHTIRFYSNDDVLVYTETLKDVKLNANRRKVKMKLKKVLESAIVAWECKQPGMEGMALVKSIL